MESCELCLTKIDKLSVTDGDVIVVNTNERPTQNLINTLQQLSKHITVDAQIIILNPNVSVNSTNKETAINEIKATITKYEYILKALEKEG